MNYQQAYNKIIDAYFRDEIKPFDAKFCFCGTLCDNKDDWNSNSWEGKHVDFGEYKGIEYSKMERALFNGLNINGTSFYSSVKDPLYEDRLFNGMCNALDVLKSIHRQRGENVDDVPVFTKRLLTQ